eukprot:CAMPEP_0179109226 /NCGR_PEP_ID=MMETSP0796-20121207/50919_1 /TAXON_ID=73915 /ORGANISM="Pyrodinium bahamense, Strain pbaha01" /LENGTH=78 /DNA_ID=CAMNT_0020807327 /DNA_START=324 /DNA_END=557 /DNA_ORIENTATION=-
MESSTARRAVQHHAGLVVDLGAAAARVVVPSAVQAESMAVALARPLRTPDAKCPRPEHHRPHAGVAPHEGRDRRPPQY